MRTPPVILNPDHAHPVVQKEIFGPVAFMIEALAFANDTSHGLSASVWGRDITVCMRCAGAFRCGIGISGVSKGSSLDAMLENSIYEKTNIINFETWRR